MIHFGNVNLTICGDWQHILQNYKKWVFPDATVLEIGASSQEKTLILSAYCKKLIGVELFQDRMPKSIKNIIYKNGDWQELSNIVPPNSIDIAFSTHVLEHVPDDLKAINELYKVLKPGGKAFLNTPNRKRLTRSIIEIFTGEKQFPYLPHEHMREYVEKDLEQLLKASRFKKYSIIPVIFGLHGGQYYVYSQKVPHIFRRFANIWEIHLEK